MTAEHGEDIDAHDPNGRARTRVMAVASAGGHWIQLFRMRPAWSGCEVTYVTTDPGYRDEVEADARARDEPAPGYVVVPDANRWQKFRLLRQCFDLAATLAFRRPHVVISTGAAPGYFALRIARLIGCRTVWIDSIANAAELSWSGARIGHHADLWLTQWEHLAGSEGSADRPLFRGSVL